MTGGMITLKSKTLCRITMSFLTSPAPKALQIVVPPPTISRPPSSPPSVLTLPVLVRERFSLNSLTLFLFFVLPLFITSGSDEIRTGHRQP
ncbi:hypothetical protein TNCV_4741891 [Trichonephila clavipes]|nr:hypothetical protein TNCV_4741891 [Trichonephila clavipes]